MQNMQHPRLGFLQGFEGGYLDGQLSQRSEASSDGEARDLAAT